MHLLFVVLYQLIQWLKFECSESEESCRWQLRQVMSDISFPAV